MIKKSWLLVVCLFALCMVGCGKEANNSPQNEISDVSNNSSRDEENDLGNNDVLPTKEPEMSYTDEYIIGQDSDYMYQMDNNGSLITRTEDGYFFRIGDCLYYADNKLENILSLCAKTNCEHIGQEEKCEAYLGSPATMADIQYYNGKVYVTSQTNLMTMDFFVDKKTLDFYGKVYVFSPDISEKKELDIKATSLAPIIHRGYAYCYYMEDMEEEVNGKAKTVKYAVLSRFNIETGEEERIVDRNTKVVHATNWINEIFAYRNYVYFVTSASVAKKEVYIYDIKNGSIKAVENLPAVKFWFMDDKILYKQTSGEEEEKKKVYISNLDFSDPQYAFSLENGKYDVGSDNLYIYADNRMISYKGDCDRIIYYYDKNTYEYLGEINLGKGVLLERYGYGDEKYYIYEESLDGLGRLMYIEKDSLKTGNIEKKVLLEWQE